MMGDNRDNSSDSRISSYVGYVPHENLVGPARILSFRLMTAIPCWNSGAGRLRPLFALVGLG